MNVRMLPEGCHWNVVFRFFRMCNLVRIVRIDYVNLSHVCKLVIFLQTCNIFAYCFAYCVDYVILLRILSASFYFCVLWYFIGHLNIVCIVVSFIGLEVNIVSPYPFGGVIGWCT